MAVLLKGGLVVGPDEERVADVRVEGGAVAEIAPAIRPLEWDDVIDCTGMLVLPGAVDAHVHYHMKTATGRTADDFTSGSLSAAFGGVTTVIDFAPPEAGMTLLESLRAREREAAGRTYTDYAFHMEITGAVPVADYGMLGDLHTYGVGSVKIYTTYGDDRLPPENLVPLLRACKQAGLLVMAHAEDDGILAAADSAQRAAGRISPADYPASRPPEAEVAAIREIVGAVRETGCPVYIAHVSTGAGARLIAGAQAAGLPVSGETCPHYLLLDERVYQSDAAQKYIMAPPLRTQADAEALWQALADGVLACVSTDHCAFTLADKLASSAYPDAIPGVGGSETLLPLLYSEGVAKGRISLRRMVQLLCENPARRFGLYPQKGALIPGHDADIVVFDPNRTWTVGGQALHSKAGYSVFDGMQATGLPVVTMRRGEVMCSNGRLCAAAPSGRFVRLLYSC